MSKRKIKSYNDKYGKYSEHFHKVLKPDTGEEFMSTGENLLNKEVSCVMRHDFCRVCESEFLKFIRKATREDMEGKLEEFKEEGKIL